MAKKPPAKSATPVEPAKKPDLPAALVGATSDFLKSLFAEKPKTTSFEPVKKPLGEHVEIPSYFFEAQKKLTERLLVSKGTAKSGKHVGRDNILNVHIGQKRIKGKPTGAFCLVVNVKKKVDSKKVQPKFRIPKKIKTSQGFVPVDVQIGQVFQPHAIAGDFCGLSVPGQGAIACYCYKLGKDEGGTPFRVSVLLTANHVIGAIMNASETSKVFEKGDDGSLGNLLAEAIVMGTVNRDGVTPSIDAAIAAHTQGFPENDLHKHRGAGFFFNDEVKQAQVGDPVFIFGPKTKRLRKGKVVPPLLVPQEIDYSQKYPIGVKLTIANTFLIDSDNGDGGPFSDEGDSGSLIINQDGNPVGILVAGDGNRSVGQDLATIIKHFRLDGVHSVP